MPLLESLELSLAARYDDYSDFGNTTNPKIGLRWEPIDSLAFRGSWGTGFRAPSLAQVGLGPSADSLFFIDTLAARRIPRTARPLDYTVIFAGNPDLKPEESENYNVGVGVAAVLGLRGLGRLLGHQADGQDRPRAGRLPLQHVLPDPGQHGLYSRHAAAGDTLGALQSINSSFINIGEQHVNGVDLNASYAMPMGAGLLTLGLDYSHLLKFERVTLGAEVPRWFPGPRRQVRVPGGSHGGQWRLGHRHWGVNAAVHYISSFDDLNASLDFNDSTRSVDSFITLNLQAR